jgi:large subunit ribosomal protein L9
MIDVILLQRIEKLGQMGEVVRVKPGYARNYLLPQMKALRATKANREQFEHQRVELEATNLKRRDEALRVAERAEGISVVMIRSAGEGGQLYGSVSARDVADATTQAGLAVNRQQIVMDKPIKTLGLATVRLMLHPEVIIDVTVNIARTPEEAERQARGETIRGEADDAAAEALAAAEAVFEQSPDAERG